MAWVVDRERQLQFICMAIGQGWLKKRILRISLQYEKGLSVRSKFYNGLALAATTFLGANSGANALQSVQKLEGNSSQSSLTYPCAALNNSETTSQYVQCLSDEANKGSVQAALDIYDIYNEGKIVPNNQELAVFFLTLAAQKDNAAALDVLALRKAIGLGTKKDWEEALRLRRRLSQLKGELPPLHIYGGFSGYGFNEAGVVAVKVTVLSDSTKKSCDSQNGSEKLNKLACNVIMKVFGFLPAVNYQGKEVDGVYSYKYRFKPYSAPPKIDTIIPAKLISDQITAEDFLKEGVTLTEQFDQLLKLTLSETGAILSCVSGKLKYYQLSCRIAKQKLKFVPAKNARGRGIRSTYNLPISVAFNGDASSKTSRPVEAALPADKKLISPNLTAPEQANSEDRVLNSAISRCLSIGFSKETSEYRNCILEQIRILSK